MELYGAVKFQQKPKSKEGKAHLKSGGVLCLFQYGRLLGAYN
jgi:hypothetical protein